MLLVGINKLLKEVRKFQSLIIRSNNVTPCLFYILFINNLQVQISFFKKKPKKLTHIFQNYALIDIIK